MKRLAILLLLLAAPAAAQFPAIPEEIGPWRLSCVTDRMTDRGTCQMRHREPLERAAEGDAALVLEVGDRAGRLVPQVAARELSLESAGRGLLAFIGTAQLRFPPNRLFEMPCALEGRALVCSPTAEDAARAAVELPQATHVLVRMTGIGGGMAEPVELPLERTAEALARFRARAPEGSPPPAATDGRVPQLLNRLQQLLGN
jgi:hypothetical protein